VIVRRAAAWLSTALLAILVALAVPVSQWRMVSVIKECCCPDPETCHCPHPKPDDGSQSTLRACHTTEQVVVTPQLPAFRAVSVALVQMPARSSTFVEHTVPSPHPTPPPSRPDAPS
jgi:hypothetical protein